jgi:erythromycin esterase
MLEFLVSEMGFTVFGIEATMPEAFDINEYVLTGEGDPAKALAGLYFWTWNTEEVLAMIEWMRQYNADPSHSRKVKFYGFDMQSAPRAVKVLLDYLRAVDPADAVAAEQQLRVLANPYTEARFVTLSKEERASAASAIGDVLRRLDDRRAEYVSRTDPAAWALARQHASVVAQYIDLMLTIDAPGELTNVRDSAMAENIRWILDREGPDAKMVVWAHNGHVATQTPWMGMGVHLRRALGPDMVVFGFAFNQGSFQAIELPLPSKRGLRSFTVEPAPDGSFDATLAAAGLRLAVIDLHALPPSGPVAEWFAISHATRSIGAVYGEESPADFLFPQTLPDRYDGLLFIESTTAARPNPGGRRVETGFLDAPANLDFEEGDLGDPPTSWFIPPQKAFGFDVTITADRPYHGERSVMISRPPGRHYGETYGFLRQRINAAPYRGRRVRLRSAVRTEVTGPGNQGYLWLSVAKKWVYPSSTVFYDDMSDRPITHGEWREYEIVGDVPEDAETIDYGMALVGEGRAWIDAMSVEVVDQE